MDNNNKNQLLCTFTKIDNLDNVIEQIKNNYVILNDRIFIFYNKNNKEDCYITYNVYKKHYDKVLMNTISVHRKNKTNTIYTINALNKLIQDENEGVLDKTYQIDWNLYADSLILVAGDFIKIINLSFLKLLNLN